MHVARFGAACLLLAGSAAPAQNATDATEGKARALQCLAAAIDYEAGHESVEGQQAVAEVIMNRLRHPAYPKTVCGVVFQGSDRRTGCQFTFTCDGSIGRRRSPRPSALALEIAKDALDGRLPSVVGSATHYHADYVSPYWAPSLIRVGTIGAHNFYRLPGTPDMPPFPTNGFANEPIVTSLSQAEASPPSLPRRREEQQEFRPWGLSLTRPASGPTR